MTRRRAPTRRRSRPPASRPRPRTGQYDYRRVPALLRQAGWPVNAKLVARLWRNHGFCIRLRPAHTNHVWAYDFLTDRTHDGRAFRVLTIGDEFTREGLAIVVARQLTADAGLVTLTERFLARGCPACLRSDNGPEFCAKVVREWLHWLDVRTLCIEPGSPWENGYSESFNGKLRDALLDREIFFTLQEAQVLIKGWRQPYNGVRPHSALGCRPPAPEAVALPHLALSPRLEVELARIRN